MSLGFLIVNSDDLGISNEVNDEIFRLIELGLVTSSTLLINAPFAIDAIKRSRDYPHVSFGLHLDATQFNSLPPHIKEYFKDRSLKKFILLLISDFSFFDAVFTEFSNQIQRAIDLGLQISHIDGHHHCHTYPELIFLMKKLVTKFGVTKIRLSRNIFGLHEEVSCFKYMYKYFINKLYTFLFGLKSTDGFMNFIDFYNLIPENLDKLPMKVEIMTHPGNQKFMYENHLLLKEWRSKLPDNITFVNYYHV